MLTLSPVAGQGDSNAPVVALPRTASTGTDSFFVLDLRNGGVARVDQLRRDALKGRSRRLTQNLFQDIGRPQTSAATTNEIFLRPIYDANRNARSALFVETSTGYVAYFEQLGKGSTFGRISTVINRPFAPIAVGDGRFALLMKRGSNGRTEGAYLYHATTGRALYFDGLAKLEIDPTMTPVPNLPTLSGQVTAAELQSVDEETVAFLVVDGSDGSMRYFDLNLDRASRISVRESPLSLFPTFDTESKNPSPQRFIAVPVQGSDDNTEHVFFVDAGNGDTALLENVNNASRPTMRKLSINLYSVLRTDVATTPRTIVAVPNVSGNGTTNGIWLIDSITRAVVYIQDPATPGDTTLRRVTPDN